MITIAQTAKNNSGILIFLSLQNCKAKINNMLSADYELRCSIDNRCLGVRVERLKDVEHCLLLNK